MITDKESNFVYLSDLLEKKCPDFFVQFTGWLDQFEVRYGILPGTKDIWVRDFMPIQVTDDYFVQYRYDPDYLKPKKYQSTRTKPEEVCQGIGLVPNRVSIVLDAGNVVKHKNKIILTSKVIKDNPDYPENNLVIEIKNQLRVEQVIIIPQEPGDRVGHADGMVRFIDENTVLINRYPANKACGDFGLNLRWSLRNAGLHYVELPYDSWQNSDPDDATGCYINFLETGNHIFYPIYGNYSDQHALIQLQGAFPDRQLVSVDCRELAKLGGVLNCATWNILR